MSSLPPGMSMPTNEEFLERIQIASPNAFEQVYKNAKKLEDALQKGDQTKLERMDFSTEPMCARCGTACLDPRTRVRKALVTAGCKSTIYCSKKCQEEDWKKPLMPNALTHKQWCEKNKVFMTRHAEFRAVFEQFPWSRIESDGTFALDLYKARQSLLGSDLSFGYWRVAGGLKTHDIGFSAMRQLFDAPPELQQFLLTGKPTKNYPPKLKPGEKLYIHGGVMLEDSWPTDVEAWHLKDETWVPRLFFGGNGAANDDPPVRPKPGQVKDWKSWYEWRSLSLESPAALLMDAPLSTYHLLVDILKVADPSGEKRQTLEVHYLGVETEMNFLPLFSELALLLPNTHIEFTVFGKPAYDLVKTARRSHPSSLATQDIVWSYTAPKRTGGGSINIRLYSKEEYWTVPGVEKGDIKIPDAIIATNAGLLSYPPWPAAQGAAAGLNIPFAATEYAEQSLVLASESVPRFFRETLAQSSYMSPEFRENMTKQGQRSYSVTVNPFHRPGARSGVSAWAMPNYYNGFVLPVVLKV